MIDSLVGLYLFNWQLHVIVVKYAGVVKASSRLVVGHHQSTVNQITTTTDSLTYGRMQALTDLIFMMKWRVTFHKTPINRRVEPCVGAAPRDSYIGKARSSSVVLSSYPNRFVIPCSPLSSFYTTPISLDFHMFRRRFPAASSLVTSFLVFLPPSFLPYRPSHTDRSQK